MNHLQPTSSFTPTSSIPHSQENDSSSSNQSITRVARDALDSTSPRNSASLQERISSSPASSSVSHLQAQSNQIPTSSDEHHLFLRMHPYFNSRIRDNRANEYDYLCQLCSKMVDSIPLAIDHINGEDHRNEVIQSPIRTLQHLNAQAER